MTLNELKEIVDKEIANGNGDAIIVVQANADNISDIAITGYEGCGYEFFGDVKVFSLESNLQEE